MSVAGIDLGISKIAVAILEGEELQLEVYHSDRVHRPEQLSQLARFAYNVISRRCVQNVFIEDNLVGNNVKYSIKLAQTMGAVMSQLVWPYHAYTANVGTWKKELLGNGNANKLAIQMWLKEHHPAYAELCDGDQDAYDAICIALYGAGVIERAQLLEELR
jgi:Holliday junction resolvasome RuvABC endonuclease subunit